MKCPYCNKDVKDGMKFCTNCGKEIPASADIPEWKKYREADTPKTTEPTRPTADTSFKTPPSSTENYSELRGAMSDVATALEKKLGDGPKKYTIPAHISPDMITPCDGEVPVRQYVFSKMRFPFFRYISEGILQVTNKRIIYNLIGSSIAGQERAHSEFSIDDVAGISVEKSITLSLMSILVYLVVGIPLFAAGMMFGMIADWLNIVVGAIGILVALFMYGTKHYAILHYVCAFCADVLISATFTSSIANIVKNTVNYGSSSGNNIFQDILGVISFFMIMFFIYMNIVSYFKSLVKNTISVVITSKSGAATPINCSQISLLSLSSGQLRALCDTESTTDTNVMIRDLGAMVMDIQKQGDYAIEKWRK